MTVRSRPSTDEQRTTIHDPDRAPHGAPHGAPPRPGASVELATPTEVAPPPRQDRSEPIRVISHKAPGETSEERRPVKQHQPRLRRLSEVVPQRQRVMTPPGGFGYLAPPRDPREARTRRWRDYVLWGSVVVMLAGAVMLAVWFIAGMG